MWTQEYPKKQNNLSNTYQSSISSSYLYPFINDVQQYTYIEDGKNIIETTVTEEKRDEFNTNISTNFPLFFNHGNNIKTPTKIEVALRRHTPRNLLYKIHTDIDVSVELCLLYTSNFTSTYFEMIADDDKDGSRALKSEYLREYFSTSPLTYKYIREALEYPLETGSILLCDHKFKKGAKSFHYRLGDAYLGKGITTYQLKSSVAQELLNNNNKRLFKNAMENPICNNLVHFYHDITLPTVAEIMQRGKELVKMKYITKKGKRLVFRNKHANSYFKNPQELSFVEDDIKLYQYLTKNGLRIPIAGNDISGGRVVDSFTLMPSWIREMIKIGGCSYTEADYVCLHPNIACALYGGGQTFITHLDLAKTCGIDKDIVKEQHLSFFNKKVWQMKQSPLYNSYMTHEPGMMQKIITEKLESPMKHNITSMRMFKKEVEIMTDVIQKLNQEGIYLGYVYDALFCQPKYANRIKEVMNETILNHGVKTTAKLPED